MFALVIDAAIRSLLVAAIAWLAIKACRIRSLAMQLLIWRMVLIASIATPLVLIALPLITPAARLPDSVPLQIDLINAVSTIEWPDPAVALYSAIAGALLLREFVGLWRGWRIFQRSMPAPNDLPVRAARVRFSTELTAPATFASTILMPSSAESWDPAKRTAVMAHEQAHVSHRDFYFRLVARLYRAFFWFHPVAWMLPRHLVLIEEQLSDAAGARTMADRTAYAALLLDIARHANTRSGQVAMADDTLGKRIERLLRQDATDDTPMSLSRILVLLLALPVIGYAAAAGVDSAAYRCRGPAMGDSPIVFAFSNCSAPASSSLRPLSLPQYPSAARRSREEGTVILRLLVASDGSIREVRIKKSSGHPQLDESAALTAQQWQMTPGAVDGRPIDAWGTFAVTFKLAD